MAEPENLVLTQLRDIRAAIDSLRLDHAERLDRIEHRLEHIDATIQATSDVLLNAIVQLNVRLNRLEKQPG